MQNCQNNEAIKKEEKFKLGVGAGRQQAGWLGELARSRLLL